MITANYRLTKYLELLLYFQDSTAEEKKQTAAQGHYMAKYAQLGIKLFAETDQLKGSLRFAADEFLREDQCLSLADLAKVSCL